MENIEVTTTNRQALHESYHYPLLSDRSLADVSVYIMT